LGGWGFHFQKISTQALTLATANVPTSHLPPPHLYPQEAYSGQDSIKKKHFSLHKALPPEALRGTLLVCFDEEAASKRRKVPCQVPNKSCYSVKKGSQVSRLQPGFHKPNSPWAGII